MSYNNYFGNFGGRYVAEVLRGALDDLEKAFLKILDDPGFWKEFQDLQKQFVGRPTPLMYAEKYQPQARGSSNLYKA
jgi:tryptophan synthase beta chain